MARRKKQPIQINSVADKMKAESQCRLCGRLNRGSGGRELTKHRLVPGRHGGEYIVANVIPLCRRCHDEVEAQDPLSRRMLRPKLWPMEVAHAIKKINQEWFDHMYPKPAVQSLSMNEVDRLYRGWDQHETRVNGRKKSEQKTIGWEWIQKNPEKWYQDTAKSGKSLARTRGMNPATSSKFA